MISGVFSEKFKRFTQENLSYFSELDFSIEEYKDFSTKRAFQELIDASSTNHDKTFVLDMDTFYKGLSSEIIGFYKRVEKQLLNVKKLDDEFDYTWNFVSEYYLSFFLITTLTRFSGEFSIFLYQDEANIISNVAAVYKKEAYRINQGQYVVTIDEKDYDKREVTVKLTPKRDTHSTAWHLFDKFLRKYRKKGNNNDTIEDNILASLQQFFKEESNILSKCRNDVNYKYNFGYDSIGRFKLYEDINWSSDFVDIQREILKLPNNPNRDDCIKNIVTINYFLVELLQLIYSDFTNKIKK